MTNAPIKTFIYSFIVLSMVSCSEQKNGTENTEGEAEETVQELAFAEIPESLEAHINSLLEEYESLKNALVEDKPDVARTASQDILNELKNFDKGALSAEQLTAYKPYAAQLKADGLHLIVMQTVDHQRNHLESVTEAMYGMIKTFGGNENELFYQYCPMAYDNQGAYWLSANEEIMNPYFGDAMLSCGSVEETIEGK